MEVKLISIFILWFTVNLIQTVQMKTIDFSNLKQNLVNTYDFDTFIASYTGTSSGIQFFSYTNVVDLLNAISTQFPDISKLTTIGKSYEGRDIMLLTLGQNITGNEGVNSTLSPSILLTSAHHAREVLSVTMNIYTTLSIIHGYYHPPSNSNQNVCNQTSASSCFHNNLMYTNLMKNHNIYILPLVNIDGYYKISNLYDTQGIFELVRKNMRVDSNCEDLDVGVDLNRNYAYKWALDDIGSSPDSCNELYRGASSFSEPETQAIRDFVTATNRNIKITINFHTFGNLLNIPYNYDDQLNLQIITSNIYDMYEDIRTKGNLPIGMLFGNSMQTTHYKANGEASDWMATQNGMLALSPKLGTHDSASNDYLPDISYVQPIMEENYKWIFYTALKLSSQLELKINRFTRITCDEVCTEYDKNYQRFYLELQLQNLGFLEAQNVEVKFTETPPFTVAIIDGTESGIAAGYANILKLSSLPSLQTKTWRIECRITNANWNNLILESLVSSDSYLSFSYAQYPCLNSGQSTSKSFDKIALLSAEPASYEAGGPSGSSYKYLLIIGGIVLLIGLTLTVTCIVVRLRNRNRDNDERKPFNDINSRKSDKIELGRSNINDDNSEDEKI